MMILMEVETPAISIYSRALAEAKVELLKLTYEIESLSKRKAQIEAVIANLTPLLPQVASPTLNFPKQDIPVVSTALLEQPIWKSILQSLNGNEDSFSVRDAIDALERIGRPIESPNRFQIVRAVLKKKTDNFEQIKPGVFAIKRKEKEVPSEEKTS